MMDSKCIIALLALKASLIAPAFAAEELESKKDSSKWTKSVKQKNTDFAIDKKDEAEKKALTTLKNLSKNIQALKKEVVSLNKDLRVMEEKILFPSSTKYSVFVSLSSGQFFTLESIKLKIDGKLVTTHLYSEKQRAALARGGIQKLYITNLNEGKHSATAFFTGIGPNGRPYKRAENLRFEKGPGAEYLELAIGDDGATQEPVFRMKQW